MLTGEGKAFCAGGDRRLSKAAAKDNLPNADELAILRRRTLVGMLSLPIPVIATVDGLAIGWGAGVVALSDLVVMGEVAYLCAPHVRYGLVGSPAAVVPWPRLALRAVAMEALLSGARVESKDAIRLGLANRHCPVGEELASALAMTRIHADPPLAGGRATKQAINRGLPAEIEASGLGW